MKDVKIRLTRTSTDIKTGRNLFSMTTQLGGLMLALGIEIQCRRITEWTLRTNRKQHGSTHFVSLDPGLWEEWFVSSRHIVYR